MCSVLLRYHGCDFGVVDFVEGKNARTFSQECHTELQILGKVIDKACLWTRARLISDGAQMADASDPG